MNFTKTILSLLGLFLLSPIYANVDSYFHNINKDPNALYSFFKIMPKGGELHYHLAGGAYPETMLELAANSNYCLDKNTFAVSKDSFHCEGVNIKEVFNNSELYSNIIKDWSMKDFIPGQESGHDHFFNGFIKYMPIVIDYRPQLLADIIQRAAQQKEQYLEIMTIPDNAHSLSYGDLIKDIPSYDKKRQILLANKDFQSNIKNTVLESDRILTKSSQELGCKTNPTSDSCNVKIKFIYYVLREQPLDNIFAQALNAFEAVSQSKGNLIGVNLVQPEDGIVSLRDYHKHMLIFEYLHQIYPNVPISLHAGELSPQAVTPDNLSNHIRDAVLTGHARRIGHGVDIGYENNAEDTLKHMASNHIPVEINLISNLKILNISGRNHPLNYYLSHKVPVVLSTDDEGVLRTDLTRQYVEAAMEHGLNYQQLKQINRNTLTYSFLPGKSIWANADKAELTPDCYDLGSKSCQKFIKDNEKAKLQWNLEQKLIAFENNY